MSSIYKMIQESIGSAMDDYKRLPENYPNAKKFYDSLISGIEKSIPSNSDLNNTDTMKEWSLNAALNAPMLGVISKLPVTEFSKAHKLAQKNATLPIGSGGLGLHPNNTSMERAAAMGFDNMPVYHGTNKDIKNFDVNLSGSASNAEQYGSGIYTTTNPGTASGYANNDGANVLKMLIKLQKPIQSETKKELTKPQIRKILNGSKNIDDALWNYGDVSYEGRNRVFNEAVNSIHDYQGDNLLENLHPIANDFY